MCRSVVAPSKDLCANATLAAAGVNARQQIATAQSYILNSAGPFGDLIAYGVAVNTGGPLDIKDLPDHSPQNLTDVAAGNISFGVTCPFGATFCQVAAGLAQGAAGLLNQISGGRYGHGAPGPASTYFDSPSDNAQIKKSTAMYRPCVMPLWWGAVWAAYGAAEGVAGVPGPPGPYTLIDAVPLSTIESMVAVLDML